MTTTAPLPLTAKAMVERLRRHYLPPGPMPGGVFAHEVGWNGGVGGTGRCDAIYAGFTSASGRILIGHEIKVSRADWLTEIGKPHKADPWADSCHAWYVVAPSTDIVKPEEVPDGWGLLVVNPRTRVRLTCAVKAKAKPAGWQPPWEAVRSFMARVDTLRAEDEHKVAADIRADLRANAEKQVEAEVERRLLLKGDHTADLAELRLLHEVLQLRVVGGTRRFMLRDNEVDEDVVRKVGDLLRAGESLDGVARYLVKPYGNVLHAAEARLADLRKAMERLVEVAAENVTVAPDE